MGEHSRVSVDTRQYMLIHASTFDASPGLDSLLARRATALPMALAGLSWVANPLRVMGRHEGNDRIAARTASPGGQADKESSKES